MKTKVYLGIAIRIIALCTVGMLMTYVPDQLRGFFGDVPHVCATDCSEHILSVEFDKGYDWGARHYWYFWMMFILFLLSILNVIISCVRLVIKNYPELEL